MDLPTFGRVGPTGVGEIIQNGVAPAVDRVIAVRSQPEARTRVLGVPPLVKEFQRRQPCHPTLLHKLLHYSGEGEPREDRLLGHDKRAPRIDRYRGRRMQWSPIPPRPQQGRTHQRQDHLPYPGALSTREICCLLHGPPPHAYENPPGEQEKLRTHAAPFPSSRPLRQPHGGSRRNGRYM
jgi:hypothetical protein